MTPKEIVIQKIVKEKTRELKRSIKNNTLWLKQTSKDRDRMSRHTDVIKETLIELKRQLKELNNGK